MALSGHHSSRELLLEHRSTLLLFIVMGHLASVPIIYCRTGCELSLKYHCVIEHYLALNLGFSIFPTYHPPASIHRTELHGLIACSHAHRSTLST